MTTTSASAAWSPRVPVSVVIPCYRCAATIERAVASVAAQSQLPERVILVEDCSGDDTLARLYQLQSRYPAGWIEVIAKPRNGGPGETRNIGWEAAATPYVAFLDADDSWHPRKLELQYRLMADDPELALTGHRGRNLDGDAPPAADGALPARPHEHARPVPPNRLLLFNEFITRSVMLRRDLPQRFEPHKKYCEDYLLWMQIVFAGHKASVLELPLAYAFKADSGDGGLSQHVWRMEKGELDAYRRIFRAQRIGPLVALPVYLFSLAKFARRYLFARLRRLRRSLAGPAQAVGG
jgi:glycosyltransferase involved in cell wall biosynthesis